jgi:hypothetical protein
MRTVTSLTNGLNNLKFNQQPIEQKKISIPPQAVSIVNNLFNDLKGICTAWKQTFSDPTIEQSAKKQWAQAFIENGIVNQHQIDIGMVKARRLSKPWFPSSGEFIAWCKPNLEDYGLMPAERALRSVIDGQKSSHPVLFVTAQVTGSWALKNMSHKDLLPLFTRNYEVACRRFIDGEDLSVEIHKALPTKVTVVTTPEQVAKNAAKLRVLFTQKIQGVA